MSLQLIRPGQRKGNRFYLVRGRVNGQSVEVSTRTADPETAERFRAELEAGLWAESSAAPPPVTTGFRAVAEKRMLAHPPSRQDRVNIEQLIAHFGNDDVRLITEGDIHIAAHKLRAGRSNATKNRHVIAPAVTILHFAAREKLCDWIRCAKLDAALPPPRDMSIDDARAVLQAVDAIPDLTARARVEALLILLFFHGPRISEAIALNWERDIDMKRRQWRKRVKKKKGGPVIVWKTMSDDLFLALANLPGDHKGRVFPWYSRWQVYKALEPVVTRAGVKFTPHMARHTFTQQARDSGADDRALMALNDWSTPAMPARYSRVKPAEQNKFLDAVGEKMRGKVVKLLA